MNHRPCFFVLKKFLEDSRAFRFEVFQKKIIDKG